MKASPCGLTIPVKIGVLEPVVGLIRPTYPATLESEGAAERYRVVSKCLDLNA
jgi:hypothetical protein